MTFNHTAVFLTSLLLLTNNPLQAQTPAEKIPHDAELVTRINIPGILHADVSKKLPSSAIMEGFCQLLFDEDHPPELALTGLNLQEDAYFYMINTDSIHYNITLFSLNHARYLDSIHQQEMTRVPGNHSIRHWQDASYSPSLFWNDALLLVVDGNSSYDFFNRPEVKDRYGIPDYSATDDYSTNEIQAVESAADAYDEVPSAEEEVALATEVALDPPAVVSEEAIDNNTSTETIEVYHEDEVIDLAEESESTYSSQDVYAIKRRVRDSAKQVWLATYAFKHFEPGFPATPFKYKAKDFKSDPEVLVDAWMPHVGNLYAGIFQLFVGRSDLPGYLNGIGGMNLRLKADKQALKLEGRVRFQGNAGKDMLKLYRKKLDPKLLKYINEDAVAFVSYAFNMREYLEGMPTWIGESYANLWGTEQDLIRLAMDVFSILLDEKSAARLMTGDYLMVLNGISEQETWYTAYEYDETEFRSVPVRKKKKELMPDGILMFTTEEPAMWSRLLKTGEKQEVLAEKTPGIYTYTEKSGLHFYFMVHEGVVFAGTNIRELRNIQLNKPARNLSSLQRNLVRRHFMSGYLNTERLIAVLTQLNENRRDSDLQAALKILNQTGAIYFKGEKQGNSIQASFTGHAGPGSYPNAFTYLLDLISMMEDL